MQSSKKAVIAALQLNTRPDTPTNLKRIYQLLIECKKRNAALVSLPEAFAFLGDARDATYEKSEALDGPIITQFKEWAKEFKFWMSLGGFQERSDEQARINNANILMDQEGEIRAVYRKTHLFDIDVKGAPQLKESSFTKPGTEIIPPFDTPVGRLGLSICYDLRFPELYRTFFYKGVDVILVPSAFLSKTGQAHWEVLLRARAIENQCYVVAAAQVGPCNEKRTSHGHTMIIDPWGTIVEEMNEPVEGVISAQIDLEKVQSTQAAMPCREHLRGDLYPQAKI